MYDEGATDINRTLSLVETIPCTSDRFHNETAQTEFIGLGQEFTCPKEINHQLLGTITSKYRNFFKLNVEPCK